MIRVDPDTCFDVISVGFVALRHFSEKLVVAPKGYGVGLPVVLMSHCDMPSRQVRSYSDTDLTYMPVSAPAERRGGTRVSVGMYQVPNSKMIQEKTLNAYYSAWRPWCR